MILGQNMWPFIEILLYVNQNISFTSLFSCSCGQSQEVLLLHYHKYDLFPLDIWQIDSQHGNYFLGSSKSQLNYCWESTRWGIVLLFLADHYIFNINKASFTLVSTQKIRLGPQSSQKHQCPALQLLSLCWDSDKRQHSHWSEPHSWVVQKSTTSLSLLSGASTPPWQPYRSGSTQAQCGQTQAASLGKNALGRWDLHLSQTLSPVCAQPYI